MNKLIIYGLLLSSFALKAQENRETLGKKISDITFKWDLESIALNSYEGLLTFCNDKEYRYGVIDLIKEIHHYDSVLYDRLKKANRLGGSNKEINRAIKEIEKFEKEYSARNFIAFLREECISASYIEKNSKELKNELASESYDGQILIVENLLNKYIKHITKRLDHIREHVQHLHIE
ncbi:MAG: hypothetical protein RIA69_00080 [Cyclobacteriaceae bacterium]